MAGIRKTWGIYFRINYESSEIKLQTASNIRKLLQKIGCGGSLYCSVVRNGTNSTLIFSRRERIGFVITAYNKGGADPEAAVTHIKKIFLYISCYCIVRNYTDGCLIGNLGLETCISNI